MILSDYNIPVRLGMMVGLTNLLKTVTPANGFQMDLSDYLDSATGEMKPRVFRGRNSFGSTDPMPMVAILENPHAEQMLQQTGQNSGVNLGPKELLIQGFVDDDTDNPTDLAHILEADVQQCLALHKQSFYGQRDRHYLGCSAVYDLQIGAGVVRPGDNESPYANFWMLLTVEIGEDMANPFAWT